MNNIRLLICGINGAMGKTVLSCIKEAHGVEAVCGYDHRPSEAEVPVYTSLEGIKEEIDCVLDFSHYSAAKDIAAFCAKQSLPLVSATTGLDKETETFIKKASEKTAIVRSKNFSYGINVLQKLAQLASKLLYEDFDIEIVEAHHNKKADAPSGTAQMLADTVKDSVPTDTNFVYGRHGKCCKREKDEITIHSLRGGSIPGEHEIIFAGNDEIIKLSHTALSKKVFAIGALKAARFAVNKPQGYYTMEDVINSNE